MPLDKDLYKVDLDFYKSVITETSNIIAFKDDNSDIVSKAEIKLKEYLNSNTGITDDKKAELYAIFLSETVKNSIIESIRVAGEMALNKGIREATVEEISQKIDSMKEEDKARNAQAVATIAKTKAEAEVLIPSQANLNTAQTATENARATLITNQAQTELKQALLLTEQIESEKSKTTLIANQANTELAQATLMTSQSSVENAKATLIANQAQTELIQKQLLEAQKDVALEQKTLIAKQASTEEAQAKLVEEQAKTESNKRRSLDSESKYKDQQAQAVMRAIDVNAMIESWKNQTQIEVATIYATGGVR